MSLKSVLIKINKNFAVFNCFLHFLKPFSLGKFSGDFLYFGGNLGEILKSSGENLPEGVGNPGMPGKMLKTAKNIFKAFAYSKTAAYCQYV